MQIQLMRIEAPVFLKEIKQGTVANNIAVFFVTKQMKQRIVDIPHKRIFREKNAERTENLQLFASVSIVPAAEKRPKVRFSP